MGKLLEIEYEKIEKSKNKYEENSENIQKLKDDLKNKDKNIIQIKIIENNIKELEKEKTLLENDFKINDDMQKDLDKKVLDKDDYERIHNLFIIDILVFGKSWTTSSNINNRCGAFFFVYL